MSAGPFGDRGKADVEIEKINKCLSEGGFSSTLASFLKFLMSVPERPDQPTLALLKMLGIPHERVDNTATMAILRKTRLELIEEMQTYRKLKTRHDELSEMFTREQQGDGEKLNVGMDNVEKFMAGMDNVKKLLVGMDKIEVVDDDLDKDEEK